jgi:hypothetical protein
MQIETMKYTVVYMDGQRKEVDVQSIRHMQNSIYRTLRDKAVNTDTLDNLQVDRVYIDMCEIKTIEECDIFFQGISYFKNYLFNC